MPQPNWQHQIPVRMCVFYFIAGPPKNVERLVVDSANVWSYSREGRGVVIRDTASILPGVTVLDRRIADFNHFAVYDPSSWRRWCHEPTMTVTDEITLTTEQANMLSGTILGQVAPKDLFRKLGRCKLSYRGIEYLLSQRGLTKL